MRRFYLLGFLALLAFDTLGQVSFKIAAVSAAPPALDIAWMLRIAAEEWTYLAVLGYLGSFVMWMTLLQHAPVGPAFAASHLEIVSVLVISVVALGETLSAPQVAGAILILAGVAILATSEQGTRGEPPASGGSP